ncbi:ArnT family glycosyltransferase [Sporolactobacillus putidus]|uniref:Dolichyl-phosphate-mannose--protein mannosyltransferase n=1 Tax=Sporolactobacillus putidus TaxID=492735 RepID=A0A917S5R6_9BACL|nr:glycosyltransferase family 39 protein [Sporolactobacillus putidus]GGL55283.1 dolichyl-phosphate-mannose--protein mannosyltransferase [Sporolactobacillus putidus]
MQVIRKMDGWLVLIVCLSLVLNFWDVWTIQTANPYYMAAITSMTKSFHNFFFASFDPAGFVSVDKPPLALWVQTVFALVFGIHGWSVILPQALAEAGSVLLIYFLIKPSFGRFSARVAALLLATTPVAVAVSRTNNLDPILIFVLLIGTFFLFKSIKTHKDIWLYASFAMLGLGFNVKMLQAYIVLPAFILFYLVASDENMRKRLSKLTVALVVMLLISFSWAFTVDHISKYARPYVGSSMSNSVAELALGYNGSERFLGQSTGLGSAKGETTSTPVNRLLSFPRLLRVGYGTQISWFLPFTFFGMLALYIILKEKDRRMWFKGEKGREAIFWAVSFITAFIFFNLAGFFHRYYFIMLAPSISALCGIGWRTMRQLYEEKNNYMAWFFPLSILTTALLQSMFVGYYFKLLGILMTAAGIIVSYHLYKQKKRGLSNRLSRSGILAIIGFLVFFPLCWAVTPILFGGNNALPEAGPQLSTEKASSGLSNNYINPDLIQYLNKHESGATYLFGTTDAPTAAPYIIRTGKAVMAIGGYNGTDPILNPGQLSELIKKGQIHYFYLPTNNRAQKTPIIKWIEKNGKLIPTKKWESSAVSRNKIRARGLGTSTTGLLYQLAPSDAHPEK